MNETHFLQTILSNPEDDICRLAYADWLQESGDPARMARGEFIQIQVLLARRMEQGGEPSEWVDSARLPELQAREKDLLVQYGKEWAKPIAELVDSWVYRKGFIESVTMDAHRFSQQASQLFRFTPLRKARLTNGFSVTVAQCPYLEKLSGLDFSRTGIGDAGLRILLQSPYLKNIRQFDFSHCYITDQGITALAGSPTLSQITHLNLGYNLLGLRGVQVLFDSPYWGQVRQLVLAGNYYIDNRVQQFLIQRLQGSANPSLLRSMLQTTSREERQYTNAEVRELALEAGRNPAQAVDVLIRGLQHGNRKVRSAASQMIAQLGPVEGARAIPHLVQRLYENNDLVRDHVAPALARLLPYLHPVLQRWLCFLANPFTSPQANLRDTLTNPNFPPELIASFGEICHRRRKWWATVVRHEADGNPPLSNSSPVRTVEELHVLAQRLAEEAANHVVETRAGSDVSELVKRASHKEAAWLLARLTELFQTLVPTSEPSIQETPSRQRVRRV